MFYRLTWESGKDLRRFLIANVGKDFDSIYSLLCSRFTGRDQRRLLDRLIGVLVKKNIISGDIVWVKQGTQEFPFYETSIARHKQNLVPVTNYSVLFIDGKGILRCIHPVNKKTESSLPTCYKLDRNGFKWLVKRNDNSWWVFYYRNKFYRRMCWHVETHICGGLKKYDGITSNDRSELEVIENHKFKIVRNYFAIWQPKKSIYDKWIRLVHYSAKVYNLGTEPYQFNSFPETDGYLVRVKRVSNDFAKKVIEGIKQL